MLDKYPACLVTIGTITLTENEIRIDGFEGEGVSCRDISALATAWAIGVLQRELVATLEKPGGGIASVN